MQKFTRHQGLVLPIDHANVDTDAIIPKQYLKSIERTGFGVNLFDDWRYMEPGNINTDHGKRAIKPDFSLNQERYQNASILLARDNFGCGSSREHAVWALTDFGIKVIIAPSFADIFFNNSFNNGLLLITLAESIVDDFFKACAESPGFSLDIDLENQTITSPDGNIDFEIDQFLKHRLLNGLDDIGLSLEHRDKIAAFEANRKVERPWLFSL
jgi:3-isopropylmalate/(R)-2-methylmalate dehydratase small subunit